MLVVIDYKVGNLGSIENMLKRLGQRPVITSDPKVVKQATKLILPGVGAFDTGMRNLTDLGLKDILDQKVRGDKTSILGICVGMQVFAEGSEEGVLPGLGWCAQRLVRFAVTKESNLKVPHMGWNRLERSNSACGLFQGLENPRFYFAHSFHFSSSPDDGNIAAWSRYGAQFPAVIHQGNIYGVQFHPEKSHKYGMKLLRNFVERC